MDTTHEDNILDDSADLFDDSRETADECVKLESAETLRTSDLLVSHSSDEDGHEEVTNGSAKPGEKTQSTVPLLTSVNGFTTPAGQGNREGDIFIQSQEESSSQSNLSIENCSCSSQIDCESLERGGMSDDSSDGHPSKRHKISGPENTEDCPSSDIISTTICSGPITNVDKGSFQLSGHGSTQHADTTDSEEINGHGSMEKASVQKQATVSCVKFDNGEHQKEMDVQSVTNLKENVPDGAGGSASECKKSGDLDFTCPFCNLAESSVFRLEFHIETTHPDSLGADFGTSGAISSLSTSYSNPHDLPSLSAGVGVLQFVCPLCDIAFDDEMTLAVHLSTAHEEEEQGCEKSEAAIKCFLCDATCSSEEAMKDHIKAHGSDQTFYGVSVSENSISAPVASGISQAQTDFLCPVCSLGFADSDLLTSHVESHFNSRHAPGPSTKSVVAPTMDSNKENVPVKPVTKAQQGSSENLKDMKPGPSRSRDKVTSSRSGEKLTPSNSRDNLNYKQQYEQNLEKAFVKGQITAADYHEQRSVMTRTDLKGFDDGHTRTQGLIQKLESLYRIQAWPGQQVFLCSPTDHFSGSYGDKGWGCGYRNFQMMLSCLLSRPDFAARICPDGNPAIPSIPKIQQMIEAAWQKGFDPQGCAQLGGRLSNTRKWIGATEIVAVLSSLGIKCHLAEFHAPTASDGTHPQLLEWVSNYFRRGQHQFCPPLYLQHQGHSRTVVGAESDKGTLKLLLFDPGVPYETMSSLAKGHLTWKQIRTFRRTQMGFKSKQYQVVAVMGLLTDAEYEESKTLRSERVS